MKFSTFVYSVKQGIINIGRNKMFSLASIATMGACIFLFGIFYSVVSNFSNMVTNVEKGVAVTVFFKEGITDEEIDAIGAAIRMRPEVKDCIFKSADEAWEEYKAIYFEGSEELAEGFADDNPLKDDASYEIYLNDVSMQKVLVTYLENLEGIRTVNQSEVVANTLTDFNRLISYISIAIILILLCVAIFLINNTVAVGISVRKDEIGIMKFIGATDFFVRAPFVVEGILIGLVGAMIPLVILYLMYSRIIVYIAEKFNFLSGILTFIPVETVFTTLVPVALLLGVGIGFIGSFATTRKHLKV